MNKSKSIINEKNEPQKKQKVKREGSMRNKIIAACIGAALVIGLFVVVYMDYLYVAPCVTVDGESYDINDIEVRYNVYNAEAQISMDAAYAYYLGSYSSPTEYWDVEGVKDNAISIAKDATTRNLLMYKEAVKNGLSLTDEEKEKVTKEATTFYNAMSDVRKKRAKFDLDELIEYKLKVELANKYIDQVKAGYKVSNETLETPIKAEDYDEMKIKVIVAPKTDSTTDTNEEKKLDDATLAKYKAQMETYLKEAKAGKDLSELVAEDDSLIYTYTEYNLGRKETTYQALIDALEPLKDGELCDYIIEDEKAYYVAQLVNDKSTESFDSAVESAVSSKEEELFNADLNKLLEVYDVKIGSGWDKVKAGTVLVKAGEDVSEFTAGLATDTDSETGEEADGSESPITTVVPED